MAVFVCVFQISELALEVAVLYYGGHLVVTGQMSSGALISFFIYMLELGECLEVRLQYVTCFDCSLQRQLEVTDPLRAVCLPEHCISVHGPHAGSGSSGEGFRVSGQETHTPS